MNLKVFEYILAVSKVKNFHLAAKQCGVSQPALSSAIKIFEKNIGITVFTRTTRKVELTNSGKTIVKQIQTILCEIKALSELANYQAEISENPIKIAFDESLTGFIIPEFLSIIKQRLGDIELEVYEETILTAKTKLLNNIVDIAITPYLALQGSGLISEEVVSEPILACLPKGHELCNKSELSYLDLLSERLLVPSPDTSFYKDMIRYNLLGTNIIEAQSLDGVAMMINAKMGVGFLPASTAIKSSELDLVFRPFREKINRSLHMIWRANESRTHSISHVRRAVKKYCSSLKSFN